MKFQSVKQVVFVNQRNVTTKAGKPLTFVKVADPLTYENIDFIQGEGMRFDTVAPGELVEVEVDMDGRYTSISLVVHNVPFTGPDTEHKKGA